MEEGRGHDHPGSTKAGMCGLLPLPMLCGLSLLPRRRHEQYYPSHSGFHPPYSPLICICPFPRSRELRTQKLKSHLMITQNLEVLPLKPGECQYIAMHATLTARDFFLVNFYPSGPFTCIFSQNLSRVFPVLAVANTGSCVGPQNKIGHPAGGGFPC